MSSDKLQINFHKFRHSKNPYIYSSSVPGYKRIRTLNNYRIKKTQIAYYKYMSFKRFDEITGEIIGNELVGSHIAFVKPSMWTDPFESLYYDANYESHKYTKNPIVCLCVTEHPYKSEEAAWKAYTHNGEKAVRFGLQITKLLKILDDYAVRNDCIVYIGEVKYDYTRENILKLSEGSNQFHHYYFPKEMRTEHYLSLMLLKRKAFQYENEVRIFLVRNNNIEFDDIVKIECDYLESKIISEVILEPLAPNKSNDIEDRIKHEASLLENELIIKHIKSKLDCKVSQSGLYKNYPPITIE